MNKFLKFLAASPFGTSLKVLAGTAVAYGVQKLTTSNINPVLTAIIPVITTPIINALNPADTRYGVGKK